MRHIKATPDDTTLPVSIAIVISQFNQEITTGLKEGALKRLADCGVKEKDITLVEVPGAIEIPLVIKALAKTKRYGALIALGAIIRGETTHYDYVCQQVSYGCQRVALDFDLPVVFGVLTTENEAQALDRIGGNHGHKGADSVDCALSMIAVLQQMRDL